MNIRKTIDVKVVKEYANQQLANENLTLEEKLGIITMIEFVLHETDNYNGFMFLRLEDGKAPNFGTYDWTCRKYF